MRLTARMPHDPEPDTSDGQGSSAALARGEATALAELLEELWLPLVRYAFRLLGAQDSAEDAVQDSFVRLWENRHRIEPDRPVRAYIYRTLRNRVIDELRRDQIREEASPYLRSAAGGPATPAQVAEGWALEAATERAINLLPERRREVFILAHLHDLSYREIADVMEITPRTVANHMTLALRELRTALQPLVDRRLDRS